MNLDVDFKAAEAWDASMPARMAELRRSDPVFWSEKSQLWVLSRFAEVEYASKNQELFSSGMGVRPGLPAKIGLIDEAEPRHGRLRKLINRGFSPRMVAKLELPFRQIVADRIDAIADLGECDFVEAISVPLPLLLIAEMIGIRREDRDPFHRWSNDMIAADGNLDDPEIMTKAMAAFVEYANYVTEIIEDRRRNPRDDLVSILVGAKDEGVLVDDPDGLIPVEMSDEEKELANDELIKLLVILLVAGNETTRNAISGGMQLLIENPRQRQLLIEKPALIPSAVEEMLRLVSPVHSFGRTVMSDTELRGQALRADQTVLLLYPSANRDGSVFDDPESFRVDRNPQHLAFGVGTHFCLGANLARMEMRVAFEELLRRLPDMEFADQGPVLQPSPLVRSCVRMRVRFTPERRRALAS